MGCTTAAAEARTLAVPDFPGLEVTLALESDGGDLTLTVTSGFDQAGNTVVVFNDVGDSATFKSVEASTSACRWRLVKSNGATGTGVSTLSEDVTLAAGNKFAGQGSTTGLLAPIGASFQSLTGAGAANITSYLTKLTNNGANAITLADGAQVGQLKKIQMIVDPGTDSTLTPTNFADGTSVTFADAGDFVLLAWDGADWRLLESGNDADGATAPVVNA